MDDFMPELKAMTIEELQNLEDMPRFDAWVEQIDSSLEAEIRQWVGVWQWFDYFNTPSGLVPWLPHRPVNPREFLYFWGSLDEELLFFMKLFTPADLMREK